MFVFKKYLYSIRIKTQVFCVDQVAVVQSLLILLSQVPVEDCPIQKVWSEFHAQFVVFYLHRLYQIGICDAEASFFLIVMGYGKSSNHEKNCLIFFCFSFTLVLLSVIELIKKVRFLSGVF